MDILHVFLVRGCPDGKRSKKMFFQPDKRKASTLYELGRENNFWKSPLNSNN